MTEWNELKVKQNFKGEFGFFKITLTISSFTVKYFNVQLYFYICVFTN